MHSESDVEQLRTDIWDDIYSKGPLGLADIADQRHLSPELLKQVVDHAWFVIEEEKVFIATEG